MKDDKNIRLVLERLRRGDINLEEALRQIEAMQGFVSEDDLTLDVHRTGRLGFPEVIYGGHKTPDQIVRAAKILYDHEKRVMITKIKLKDFSKVQGLLYETFQNEKLFFDEVAGISIVGDFKPQTEEKAIIVSAGSSDLPIVNEAAHTLRFLGINPIVISDVGVAGIHRLKKFATEVRKTNPLAVIVIAGMDGALPSVIGGMIHLPIIAVPTSVGYGAAFQGVAPLLTMLNSCSAGVAVVNIDSGFGAAMVVARLRNVSRRTEIQTLQK